MIKLCKSFNLKIANQFLNKTNTNIFLGKIKEADLIGIKLSRMRVNESK